MLCFLVASSLADKRWPLLLCSIQQHLEYYVGPVVRYGQNWVFAVPRLDFARLHRNVHRFGSVGGILDVHRVARVCGRNFIRQTVCKFGRQHSPALLTRGVLREFCILIEVMKS